jgi:hypothetical protein
MFIVHGCKIGPEYVPIYSILVQADRIIGLCNIYAHEYKPRVCRYIKLNEIHRGRQEYRDHEYIWYGLEYR